MIRKIDIHTHPIPDDRNMDRYLGIMDRHNVAAALVHGLEDGSWDGASAADTPNDAVIRAVHAHPDRFFGTVCVNFTDGVEKVLATIREFSDKGAIGIKLFPNYGFDPNDDAYEPVWHELEQRRMLVFSHCGWLAPEPKAPSRRISSLAGASPFHFEVPARRHPTVDFVFAHFGGGATYLETLVLTSRLANTYADTCPGWGRWVWENDLPGLSSMPRTQLLYGTDNAGEAYGQDDVWWTRKLLSMGFTDEDISRYFFGNAARLLGMAG
jgi:predicted TIM-barrel fold metal-dependent hydrolase